MAKPDVPDWLRDARLAANKSGHSVTVCVDPMNTKQKEKAEKREGNYSKWGRK